MHGGGLTAAGNEIRRTYGLEWLLLGLKLGFVGAHAGRARARGGRRSAG